jgi:AcrR family transcriptional regulator
VEEVRDRIVVESGLLFAKYGVKSMTMDSLAEELGISKRTIYERFKDKDTLLVEVIKYYKKQTNEEVRKLIDQSDNAIEALFRMSPAFFHDIKKYHQKVFQEVSESGEMRDYGMTRILLKNGIEQEVFREDVNIEIVNQTIHTLFELFGHDSKLVEAGFDRKDMFDQIIIPFFRGISTKKGRKLLVDCKTILE